MKDRETPKNVYSIKIKQTQGAKVMSREGNSLNRLLRFLSRWSVSEIVHRCFHSKARLGSSHALRIALKLMGLGGGHRKCCGAKPSAPKQRNERNFIRSGTNFTYKRELVREPFRKVSPMLI